MMRKGNSYTVSPGTGHHLFIGNGSLSQSEFEPKPLQPIQLQSTPLPVPVPTSVTGKNAPLPPPKKRASKTLTLRHTTSNGNAKGHDEKNGPSTMGPSSASAMGGGPGLSNPKRVSVATSSFWDGHPDLGHLVRGWELGLGENTRPGDRSSLWGYTFDPKPEKSRGGSAGPSGAIGASTDDLHSSSTLPSSGIGSSVAESLNVWGDPPAVKKGILLQQRDKLLARWKERYCILTRDYLHCFRRTSSIHRSSGLRLSEMGNFIFKLRLAEIDEIEWETKRGCSMLSIVLPKEPRIHVRVPGDNEDSLRQWFTLLQECIFTSKERRRALRTMYSTGTSSGIGTGTGTGTGGSSADGVSRSVSLMSDGGDSGAIGDSPSSSSAKLNSNSASPRSSSSKMSTTDDNSLKDGERPKQPTRPASKFCSAAPQSHISSNTYDKSKTENKKKYAQLLERENIREEDLAAPTRTSAVVAAAPSQSQQDNKVVLRRDLRKNTITGNTRTAEDFLRDSRHDRESSSSPPQVPTRRSTMGFFHSNGHGHGSVSKGAVQLPNGYAYPIDFSCSPMAMSTTPGPHAPKSMSRASTKSRMAPPRPESWAPSHHMIPIIDPNARNLVPGHHWMSSSRGNVSNVVGSCGDYQRIQTGTHHRTFSNCAGAMIPLSTTPSIHTSEITFRKMC